MTKISRTASLWNRPDNRRPVLSFVEGSAIQNLKWLTLSIIAFVFVADVAVAYAQPAKVVRIGFLGPNSAASTSSRMESLRAGLRDLGYVEGKNLVIESRWADGNYDRLPDLATELVRLKVDFILTS